MVRPRDRGTEWIRRIGGGEDGCRATLVMTEPEAIDGSGQGELGAAETLDK